MGNYQSGRNKSSERKANKGSRREWNYLPSVIEYAPWDNKGMSGDGLRPRGGQMIHGNLWYF